MKIDLFAGRWKIKSSIQSHSMVQLNQVRPLRIIFLAFPGPPTTLSDPSLILSKKISPVGYIREGEVERLLRDAILGQIGAGTTEIRKKLISASLVKRYKETMKYECKDCSQSFESKGQVTVNNIPIPLR